MYANISKYYAHTHTHTVYIVIYMNVSLYKYLANIREIGVHWQCRLKPFILDILAMLYSRVPDIIFIPSLIYCKGNIKFRLI